MMAERVILVAGAGAAGLVAALAAAAEGARVRLIERDLATPSTFATSGGLFSASGTRWQREAGVEDSPGLFAKDVQAWSGNTTHPGVLATVAENTAAVADFLNDVVGIPMHLHQTSRWPGHSVHRLHATPGESGAEFAALLLDAVRCNDRIALEDGSDLLGLTAGGAEISQSGTRRRAAVDAVVLATGGYAGSPELLARYAPPAAQAVHAGGRNSDGTALRIGEAVGAALACMGAYQGQPHVSPHLVDGVRPRFGASLPSLGAIMVNRAGERFVAEDIGPSELTGHLLSQPGGRAVEIWEETAQQAAMAGGPFRRAAGLGVITTCGSVAELAARFGLPQEPLAATIAAAARCARGEAEDPFDRRRWGAALAPPFHAAEVTGALAHTQGGVVVDGAARVLRPDGTVVPGLHAAGGAACGISGSGTSGYLPGNGLSQSFVLGLLAGRSAARREQATTV